ncbi:MAG: hypothetical protein Q9183_003276 [Haloplaca sp. 2 TL-2023]
MGKKSSAGAVKKKSGVSKKKKTPQKAKKEPSKKVTPAANAVASTSTNADEQTSPFLKLSVEIRNMIYGYVLGHNLIHIEYHYSKVDVIDSEGEEPEEYEPRKRNTARCASSIMHIVCTQRFTEDHAYHEGIVGCPKVPLHDDPKLHVAGYQPRHGWCWLSKFEEEVGTELFHKMSTGGPLRLDLSLLSVNRQIHREAFRVLWTSNRFSFETPRVFNGFVSMLTSRQTETLAKIEIVKNTWASRRATWDSRSLQRQWRSLQGLRSVHLYLELDQCHWQASTNEYPDFFIKQFMIFQQLQLGDIRVIVNDRGWQYDANSDQDPPGPYLDTAHHYPSTLYSDPKCPLSRMDRDPSQPQRFSWIEKRELGCHFEVILLGRLQGSNLAEGIERKLEKEKAMRDAARVEPTRDTSAYYLYEYRIAGT